MLIPLLSWWNHPIHCVPPVTGRHLQSFAMHLSTGALKQGQQGRDELRGLYETWSLDWIHPKTSCHVKPLNEYIDKYGWISMIHIAISPLSLYPFNDTKMIYTRIYHMHIYICIYITKCPVSVIKHHPFPTTAFKQPPRESPLVDVVAQ